MSDTRGTESESTPRRRAGGFRLRNSLFTRLLIVNVTVVLVGASIGTWITVHTVKNAPPEEYLILISLFSSAAFLASLVVNVAVLRAAMKPLTELQRTASAVAEGDYAVRVKTAQMRDAEIRQLAETLNRTLDELERDRQLLRRTTTQVIRAQEDERLRISRELHDDTAQLLFALLLRIARLKEFVTDDRMFGEIAALEETTVEALEGARRLALELRPPALDDLGLTEALDELVQRFSEQLGIPVEYHARGHRGRLPAETELVLYRVVQEALTNIGKHARAHSASLELDRDDRQISIVIRDDGIGIAEIDAPHHRRARPHLGIYGMEERVALVGGRFAISTERGVGTTVSVTVPVPGAITQEAARAAD